MCSDDESEGDLNLPPEPSPNLLHNFDKNPISDDSDTADAYETSSSIDDESKMGDEEDEFGVYDDIQIEEIDECKYVTKCESTYDVDENVFTPIEMNELKRREMALIERNQKGYYRCKVKHAKLYKEMTDAYAPYITKSMLVQLQHNWDTQKNEAMNTSVSCYAPKNKTYSLTESLDTRVAIAAGVQILGYHDFWRRLFSEFNMEMDDNLESILQRRDIVKFNKTQKEQSIEGEKSKADGKYTKFAKAQKEALDSHSAGLSYESGLALAAAVKQVKNLQGVRNPKGTPVDKMRCKFHHPRYCNVLGHSSAASPLCKMKEVSAAERLVVEKAIMKEAVDRELVMTSNLRK